MHCCDVMRIVTISPLLTEMQSKPNAVLNCVYKYCMGLSEKLIPKACILMCYQRRLHRKSFLWLLHTQLQVFVSDI